MVAMNKVMDPQKTAQTMRQFEMQNAKMEMTEEMSKHKSFMDPCETNEKRDYVYILQSMIHK